MKKLLLIIPISLFAAEKSNPIDIPKRKVKVYNLPKEVDRAEQVIVVPDPVFRLDNATPNNSPESHQLNWDVMIEGKLMRIRLNIEKVDRIEKKDN